MAAPRPAEAPTAVEKPRQEQIQQSEIASLKPVEKPPTVQQVVAPKPEGQSRGSEIGPLAQEVAALPKATVFKEGDVLRSKIANVRLLSQPSDNADTISLLPKGEELVYLGREQSDYLSVETPKGKGWVKKLLVTP